MIHRLKFRRVEIAMLHVGLGSRLWHWRDVLYLLTGKA